MLIQTTDNLVCDYKVPTRIQMMNRVKTLTLFSDIYCNFEHNFQIHNSVESLRKRVDPKVLPKELGGSMPMAEMIGTLFFNNSTCKYLINTLIQRNLKCPQYQQQPN